MILKPTSRKERGATVTKGFKLQSSEAKIKVEAITGGWKEFNRSQNTRLLYILKGYASAEVEGKESIVEPGMVLEVPPDTPFRLSGQIEYFSVRV
ncbi:hypothetical protein [Sutcliffiella horikoshii]|uniref:hypothetical protein n=1 Tax=Sutcliffiella horikoshii TaxID=79883 RepID=UPI003CF235A3